MLSPSLDCHYRVYMYLQNRPLLLEMRNSTGHILTSEIVGDNCGEKSFCSSIKAYFLV